jgi:hypothetical protein
VRESTDATWTLVMEPQIHNYMLTHNHISRSWRMLIQICERGPFQFAGAEIILESIGIILYF